MEPAIVKKIILPLSLLFIFQSVFCQSRDLSKNDYMSFGISWTSYQYVTPEKILSVCDEGEFYDELDRSILRLDNSGYFFYNGSILIPGIPYVVLNANGETSAYAKESNHFYNAYPGTKYSASSELKENTKNGVVEYSADNLGKFAYSPTDHYESLSWNYESKPWVEGKDDYGIGETIKLSTKESFSSITILNGYVDVKRQDLYKKNSRAKKLKVLDVDNNLEYIFELEDVVEFQTFDFKNETKNIIITIDDVYKGDKWSDTCITGLVPNSPYGIINSDKISLKQTYSYKADKNSILERINYYKKEYKKHVYENSEK